MHYDRKCPVATQFKIAIEGTTSFSNRQVLASFNTSSCGVKIVSRNNRKPEAVVFPVGNIKPHPYFGTELEMLAASLADKGMGSFLVNIIIVNQCSDRHKSFHEMIKELDIESLTNHGKNNSIEFITHLSLIHI